MLGLRPSDADLIRKTLDGHPEAFETLVLRHIRKAHAVGRAAGLSAHAAEDAAQEAFLRAFRDLGSLMEPGSFGPWLLAIVRNVARKTLAKQGEVLSGRLPERPVPGEDLEAADFREHLWRRVAELPEEVREAVFLYYHEGESVRSVARALGITASGVKKRLRRGREILRERLWRELEECLRDMLPSAREWRRKARTTGLLVLASIPASWAARIRAQPLEPLEGSTIAASGLPETIPIGTWILGGIMSAKKVILLSSVAALLLLSGGMVFINSRPSGPSPEGTSPGAAHRSKPAGGAAVAPGRREDDRSRIAAGKEAPGIRTGITGKVFREGAAAPAGVQVVAYEKTVEEPAGITATGLDGTYAVEGIRPGKYVLRAWSGVWGTAYGAPEPVDVSEGQIIAGVDLILNLGGILGVLVMEHGSEKPIPNAKVSCIYRSASTGGDGRCILEGIPAESVTVEVSAPDYTPRSESAMIDAGKENSLLVHLEKGGEIVGIVLDPSGSPASDAVVRASGGNVYWDFQARTKATGRFQIEGVPLSAKGIQVTASCKGLFFTRTVVPGFPPGESRIEVEIRLDPGFSIHGQVVDGTGIPAPDAKIFLADIEITPGEDGRFSVDGVTPAIKLVTAVKEGFAPATVDLQNLPPEKRADIRLVLEPGHSVAGIVTDKDGIPLAGASVYTINYQDKMVMGGGSTLTDEEGRFLLKGLPGAEVVIGVDLRGYSSLRARPSGGLGISVAPDDEDVRIVLREEGQIRGTAVDRETGQPIHPVRVKYENEMGGGSPFQTFIEADGSFALSDGMEAGASYRLVLDADEYAEIQVDKVEAWGLSKDREPIRVEMERGGTIYGLIVAAAGGMPVEGVAVGHALPTDKDRRPWLSPTERTTETVRHRALKTATTDGEGKFELKGLRQEDGILFLEKSGFARKAIFPVRSGSDLQVFDLEAGAILQGTVRAADGRPITTARIAWIEVAGVVFHETLVGDDGSYRVEDLPAGPCQVALQILEPSWHWEKRSSVNALASGKVTVIDFDEPPGAISGRVTVRGKPVIDGLVEIYRQDEPGGGALLSLDHDGRYRIEGLFPGAYRIRLDPPAGRSFQGETKRQVEVGVAEVSCDFSIEVSIPLSGEK